MPKNNKVPGQSQKRPAAKKETDELKSELAFDKTWSDGMAAFVTNVFGSIIFLCAAIVFFILWITLNLNLWPGVKPFDPFPFPALEMAVSVFAIILSLSVLISQKRQSKREKISQQIEFEVNIRAENEITKMLEMLHEIQIKMGISNTTDEELEEMKEPLNIQKLHEKLDEREK